MKEVPNFDIELSQATDYIMSSPLAKKAFSNPPFVQYTNILRLLVQSVDRLADNCHMPEFTNHALPHICSIVRRASEWAADDGWLDKLSEQEAGYLLLALIIHDIGMLSQDAQDLPDKDKQSNMKGFADIANWVRRTHVLRLQGLVLRLLQDEFKEDSKKIGEIDDAEEERISLKDHMMVVISMAASHQCWDWDSQFIVNRDSMEKLHLEVERIGALNSVIAVCDLLDEDSNRCDTITLIKYRHGSMENLAHWIRHALTVEVAGIRNHTVTVTFRKLVPSNERHEKIYRALRNHYRLVKLYNNRLKKINAEIEHLIFNPPDGIPQLQDEVSEELSKIWVNLPEFKNDIAAQILSTFMQEALNKDCGDRKMRQRLDKLGLETIDFTEESFFLEPSTIYFSDERILFGKKDFPEQLKYMKEQVDTAYLDGNIGKLRHLCLMALKCWNGKMSLNDMYWVFTYVAVFQKYGNEISHFEYEYNNSIIPNNMGRQYEKLVMEGEYQPLLDVLLMLLKPATGEEWYGKYVEHIKAFSYYNLKDDLATELLLETIVGLLWYYNQDGTVWLEVADFICAHLQQELKQKLYSYVNQVKKQHIIINHANEKEMTKIRKNCSHPMEKAWIDFWNDDWQKQESIIPDLCHMGNCDRNYMEPVQGYLNLVRSNIQYQYDRLEFERKNDEEKQDSFGISTNNEIQKGINNEKQEGEKEDRDKIDMNKFQKREIDIGYYRYNRIILEQPLPIFWEQRNLVMESMIGECRRQKNNSQEKRIRLIRLLALRTLDALRYWDLWQYIDALRFKTILDFLNGTYVDKYGIYCGDRYALKECFIDYIRGWDSKGLNQEEQKLAVRLLLRYELKELDTIICFITQQSIPLQWKYALNIVEVFAEHVSALQRRCLLDWLIRYDEYYKKQSKYFNSTQYRFLRYWCKDMEQEEWEKIKSILDTIFSYQTNMMLHTKLIEAVFEYAPWDMCMQYMEAMKGYPDNDRKSHDFYSAVITMSNRKDSVCIALQELVDWLLEDINEKIKLGTLSKNNASSMRLHYKELKKLIDIDKLEQLEAVNLTMIEQILDQMEQKIEQRGGLSGYDSTFMNPIKYGFVNKNWNVKDEIWEKKMINRIFSVMKRYRENISMHFFVDFCHLFLSIENSCSNHIRAYINHIVMEHMVNEDFFLEQKKSGNLNHDMWDGPYKLARIDDGSQNQYEVMVSLLLVSGMTALTEEEKPKAIKYMLKALSVDEFVIYNYATVMFSYFFLKGKQLCEDSRNGEVITSLAWGGLQFISGRLAAENIMNEEEFAEIKNWVHKALDAMAESEKWFGTEGFHVYAGKNEEYIEWLAAMNYTLKCG